MPQTQFDLIENYEATPQSAWFQHCRENSKPYVVIRANASAADVIWDYITLPPCYDKSLMANSHRIREEAIEIFERYAGRDSSLRVKPTLIMFNNLPQNKARYAADDLFALIEAHLDECVQPTMQ